MSEFLSADINVRDLFIRELWRSNFEFTRILIQPSPLLTVKDLFLKASADGDLELVRGLLALHADVNWKDSLGHSALMICLKTEGEQSLEMAKILLFNQKVDLDTKDVNFQHLEEVAREHNKLEIVKLLENFTTPKLRMIQQEARLSRQADSPPSLKRIARDCVLVSLITSNLPKREVNLEALVDGLGQEITWVERRQLVPVPGILEATEPRLELDSDVDVTGGDG